MKLTYDEKCMQPVEPDAGRSRIESCQGLTYSAYYILRVVMKPPKSCGREETAPEATWGWNVSWGLS